MAEEQDPQEVRLGARMATEGNPCGRISRSRTRQCLVRSVLACAFACLFLSRSANSFPSTEPPPVWLKPGRGDTQGLSPFAIAITKDGRYAYVNADLSEVVFKIRLSDLAIVASADLSKYFPLESWLMALDASERRLFINVGSRDKLFVLDTQSMKLVHVIDNINAIGMFLSQHTGQLVTWDGGNVVRFFDTNTYAVSEHRNDGMFFKIIR